jgi:hypothetical protein
MRELDSGMCAQPAFEAAALLRSLPAKAWSLMHSFASDMRPSCLAAGTPPCHPLVCTSSALQAALRGNPPRTPNCAGSDGLCLPHPASLTKGGAPTALVHHPARFPRGRRLWHCLILACHLPPCRIRQPSLGLTTDLTLQRIRASAWILPYGEGSNVRTPADARTFWHFLARPGLENGWRATFRQSPLQEGGRHGRQQRSPCQGRPPGAACARGGRARHPRACCAPTQLKPGPAPSACVANV